jgi:hypothetical protein
VTNGFDDRDAVATGSQEEPHEQSPKPEATEEPVPAPADTHTTPPAEPRPGDDPVPPEVSGEGSTTATQPVPQAAVGETAPGD